MIRRQQILIVDDETIVRRAIYRTLSKLPIELVEFTCGDDAIQFLTKDLKNVPPAIQLICLDWLMPRGSGRDVLQALDRLHHPARVVIMTAYGSSQINEEIQGFKVDGVMTKPFESIQQVQETISGLL